MFSAANHLQIDPFDMVALENGMIGHLNKTKKIG